MIQEVLFIKLNIMYMLNKIKVTYFPVYTLSLVLARPTAASVLLSQYQSVGTATVQTRQRVHNSLTLLFPLQ